jgi:3-hydroxymyristoyl/3-hydroxydecanoyl-(acyl carrier protein) dehydratase
MPGVLIIEAMAQCGGILLLNSYMDPASKLMVFMGINKAKFRKQVVPGDQLVLQAELISKKRSVMVIRTEAYVDNNLVAEAELMAGIVDREKKDEQKD